MGCGPGRMGQGTGPLSASGRATLGLVAQTDAMAKQVGGELVDELVDLAGDGHGAVEVEIRAHEHRLDAVLLHEGNELAVEVEHCTRGGALVLGGNDDALRTQRIEEGS